MPASASSEETYKFERMWPTLQQPWYFNNPEDIAIDSAGNVYVVDGGNNRIQKFTSSGKFITKWGSHGSGDGEFWSPTGIAIDGAGNVYVADYGNYRIQKFTSSGEFITKWGSRGSEDGEFISPKGIATDSVGNVYVADEGSSTEHNPGTRIQKFTSSGEFISKWGSWGSGDGEFIFPKGIATDSAGNVYLADGGNCRIQKFTSSGEFITKWGSRGSGDGEFWEITGIAIDGVGNVCVKNDHYIQKFTSSGKFITKWGSYSYFKGPEGIAIDSAGNVYVVEQGAPHFAAWSGSRIRKFTSSGEFISKWGSWGSGDGEFISPKGIATDSVGNVYVADYGNYRIQKFTSSGEFISKWGSQGSEDGEFWDSSSLWDWIIGMAIDGAGNVYVESGNYRIQKFTSLGDFITKVGSPPGFYPEDGDFTSSDQYSIAIDGAGDVYVAENSNLQKFTPSGEFISKWAKNVIQGPSGIAIDSAGNFYVVEKGNNGIKKFTSSGEFITGWGGYGDGDGRFMGPSGIAIDGAGNVYVGDLGNNRIQKFTPDGIFVGKFGSFGSDLGFLNQPLSLAIDSTGKVYVADCGNNRIQVFQQATSGAIMKAIIVAGGGPFPGNNLWDATQMCANFAYRTLTYQGYTKEGIYYLTADTNLDLDSNGVLDDVDGNATNANLQEAITNWAKDADNIVLYLADHGGSGTFRMSGTETLSVSDLDSWLDELQETISGRVTIIYDACESGSFLSSLTPPSGKERVVITSTSPGETAKFVTQGSVSFSNYFWTHIFNGVNLKESFVLTKNALSLSFNDQTPLLDANGNGISNEAEDYTLIQSTYIGNGTVISGDAPVIGSVSPVQTITGTSSASLYAASVTDNDGIAHVWAVIRSPDYNQGSSDNPVTSLPSIDLMPVGGDRYEATYESFNIAGTYQIAIYAMDRIGNTSIPKLTAVSVNNPLRRRAIIVAGGPHTDGLWLAIQKNAGLAYDALTFQGYTKDDIYFMSPVTFSAGVDGLPNLSNIEDALTRWATTNTQDVVLYLLGNGGNGTFKVNATENLSGTDLDTWLNSLQASIPGKMTVIYEACRSGSFLPLLTPPSGKERILISSASGSESAYFVSGGDISFSKFFWGQVANGTNVRNAFLHGKDAIQYACLGQTPQMDDNGNGTGNEKADGVLARNYTIGAGIMLAGDDPIIGSVSPAQTLSGETSATLWAKDVTSTNTISKVWAVITPPGYSSDPSNPVTDLPTLALTHVSGGRYEETYGSFSSVGTYEIAVYAMDQDGNVSVHKKTTLTQTEGTTSAPTALTTSATSVTYTSVTLTGKVNPNGSSATVAFEYGTTSNYGNIITATPNPLTGTNAQVISAVLGGLNRGTPYHFRAKATNITGTSYGGDQTFATYSRPSLPSCQECAGDPVVLTDVTFSSDTNCECSATTYITIGTDVTIKSGATVTFKAPTVKIQSGFNAENGSTINIRQE